MRKYLLIILFALVAFLGYRPVKEAIMAARGVHVEAGVLTCDYNGRTYQSGEQRSADDGCNVCACGASGWNCTQIACVAGSAQTGTISGKLSAPSGANVPAERVCAISLKDIDQEFCQQTTGGTTDYAIAAKPGDYWVYAVRVGDESGKRAYWSEYVRCGAQASCKDHSPIVVTVQTGQIASASPQDWEAQAEIDLLDVTPSKWEYNTYNYYPNSVFLVKGRGLASVAFMATSYPQNPDEAPFPIGQATLASTDHGVQTWTLPIAKGFQAWTVYAVGTAASGEYTKSHELRIVRPIDTAE